ncbi:alkaline phosphatase family protein [Nocardioides humilatus]|uniref:alkaline phosphatase family protein n=1 Tax=Nocardioides humilatus TaxID=2607660 RepID=UPI00165F6E34|nr:alkaline phosphatase family protein [Nocardioides humilatus]
MTASRSRGRRLAVLTAGVALSVSLSPVSAPSDAAPPPDTASRLGAERQVLAISLDGFNPRLLKKLGRTGAPNLTKLFRTGASTRNARSQVEMTVTLPNHTSQLTGRRIDAAEGGHGVVWNDDKPIRPDTIQEAAGGDVDSIFTQVDAAGGSTALFATESKFSLFKASWPDAVDRSTILQDRDHDVTVAARRDLLRNDRAFTFIHLGALDEAGHAKGWLSRTYLKAGRLIDAQIGILLKAIRDHAKLHDVVIVLTADHGGEPGARGHSVPTNLENYRIPFVVWGPGVDKGDLYEMNPTYADPGEERIEFEGTQPIRNGDLANLSAHLLGLSAVPGSLWGADQSLTWTN